MFFQAEDGIRDRSPSRGLGDVYKRQEEQTQNFSNETDKLSSEINKLNELLKSGVLTQEEFEKAKKKILDN